MFIPCIVRSTQWPRFPNSAFSLKFHFDSNAFLKSILKKRSPSSDEKGVQEVFLALCKPHELTLESALVRFRSKFLAMGDEHIRESMESVVGSDYAGAHWLASFLFYALQVREHALEEMYTY